MGQVTITTEEYDKFKAKDREYKELEEKYDKALKVIKTNSPCLIQKVVKCVGLNKTGQEALIKLADSEGYGRDNETIRKVRDIIRDYRVYIPTNCSLPEVEFLNVNDLRVELEIAIQKEVSSNNSNLIKEEAAKQTEILSQKLEDQKKSADKWYDKSQSLEVENRKLNKRLVESEEKFTMIFNKFVTIINFLNNGVMLPFTKKRRDFKEEVKRAAQNIIEINSQNS